MKVLLILVDGMRPDALEQIPLAQKFQKLGAVSLTAEAVVPPVTLPSHVSLFHSVTPSRHGTTTNIYAPQVRPVDGLCEVLKRAGKTCAFFYNWEPLRDVARPNSLVYSCYRRNGGYTLQEADRWLTDQASAFLKENEVDFTFLYLGAPDGAGHKFGWMSQEYMESLQKNWEDIDRIVSKLQKEYTVIITADHGGHDRMHGENIPEDMIIPMYLIGRDFAPETTFSGGSILDIAPTITKLLGVEANEEWDGKSLL